MGFCINCTSVTTTPGVATCDQLYAWIAGARPRFIRAHVLASPETREPFRCRCSFILLNCHRRLLLIYRYQLQTMVMRPGTLVKSRGNSPSRPTARSGNKNTNPSIKKTDQKPIRASPIRASPARTPPDVEFIIRNSTKRRSSQRTPSEAGSRGSSPAKSDSSRIPRSRGSE